MPQWQAGLTLYWIRPAGARNGTDEKTVEMETDE